MSGRRIYATPTVVQLTGTVCQHCVCIYRQPLRYLCCVYRLFVVADLYASGVFRLYFVSPL